MARRGSCAPDGDQCAVLGLLTWGERSGYELSKLLDQSVAYFWSSAKAQAYAVLPRLVERRFAEAPHVAQMDRPDKTVYRITAAGKRALAAGLRQEHPYLFRTRSC
jgi:DNA-binding PadR family transcriptional regulator